ncbi:hypothetical protein [Demequina sediminicola]|uniref:hypothetical protein n=1 Tax=Demequina sediminicola TaxID=1095026 RepID=UPI0007818B3C|nr:hypothetical protein [Demequina sediminicola]
MKRTVPASIAAAALAAAALTGCSYVNPITTQQNYSASDGSQLFVEDVSALNLIVLTEAVDSPATLIGTIVNDSDEDVEFTITFDGTTATPVAIDAGESIKLGPEDGDVEVSGTSTVQPGLVVDVLFQETGSKTYAVSAPVLDGTLPEYTDIVAEIG